MDKSCPYCQGTTGYEVTQQVKRHRWHAWDGSFMEHSDGEVFYQGKTMRCRDCGEKVTSFALGLQRELDNG